MIDFIYDTSVLSAKLDQRHPRHEKTADAISALPDDSRYFVSTISLAELTFGARLKKAFSPERLQTLERILQDARKYEILEIGRHTSEVYANLKAKLALRYLPNATRRERKRLRWIEDWPDNFRGKSLQVDENDLWLCSQTIERSKTLLTSDKGMARIAEADTFVSLKII